jgi:hypothetical protein
VPLKATGECLESFDLVLTVEILRVTWHDVWPWNEAGFRLVKITWVFKIVVLPTKFKMDFAKV